MEPDEIINLPEKIAHDKNLRFVICIDEFQNISEFEEPLAFQKKMMLFYLFFRYNFHQIQTPLINTSKIQMPAKGTYKI